jgi:hypothetical protein
VTEFFASCNPSGLLALLVFGIALGAACFGVMLIALTAPEK